MRFTVKVDMTPVNTLMDRLGLTPDGDAQQHLTADINRRITRYMPARAPALSTTLKRVISPTEIEVNAPYAKVMYYGKVMVDPETGAAGFLTENGWRSRRGVNKVRSNRDFDYSKAINPRAGPYWDRRLMAAEGEQIAADLAKYITRRAKR